MKNSSSSGRAMLVSGVQVAGIPLVAGLGVGAIWIGVSQLREVLWLAILSLVSGGFVLYAYVKVMYDGSIVRRDGRVRLAGDWYPQGSVVRVTSSPGPISAAPLPGAYPVVVVRDADGVEQEVGLPAHGYYMPFDRWFLPGKLEQIRRVVGLAGRR